MIKKIAIFNVNTLMFLIISSLIGNFLWNLFGKDYVYQHPVGGDYYNSLTYLLHIASHHPLPPKGWFSFWNEGAPFVGGYPFLVFYLLKPFHNLEAEILMNYFSFATLFLFLASSLLLFWQVTKNWLIASALTIILIYTRATYYQLTTGGFIVAASAQWYLPIVLFFIYRFFENYKRQYLIAGSILSGISLIHQGPASLLMVFIPCTLVVIRFIYKDSFLQKLIQTSIFITISITIGAIGLYSVFLQTFSGSGTDACHSLQCWGEYPKHLIVWLTPAAPIITIIFLTIAIILKVVFRKKINFYFAAPAIFGLFMFVFYAAAAYFKQINGIANVIFPTRTFWAINLFILLAAAGFFHEIRKVIPRYSILIGAISLLTIIAITQQIPFSIHKDFTATLPQRVHEYIIPRFKTRNISEVFKDWVIKSDPNYRIDISNPGINQWYYYTFQTPSTRGYSNHPLGVHKDWQYFLDISTRNVDPKLNEELVKNRALFLVDAFGIGVFETSQNIYPLPITKDSNIISKSPQNNELFWWEISREFTSPIVSPTSVQPLLFVGDDLAYNYFIRSIALSNLNSRITIPVRGPKTAQDLSQKNLSQFKAIFIYDSSKSPKALSKLSEFVRAGGKVFIESSSLEKDLGNLPEIFPVDKVSVQKITDIQPKFQASDAQLEKTINIANFSSLSQKNSPWKTILSNPEELRDWGKPLVTYNQKVVMAQGKLGKGFVVWSGMNLPFHVVENNNLDEAKLLKIALLNIIDANEITPEYKVVRSEPELIRIEAKNTKGIYFKENFDSGWEAQINGEKTQIYKAGLDFMYIPLPNNNQKINAVIEYKGSLVSWFLFYLSGLSLIIASLLLLTPKLLLKIVWKIITSFNKKLGTKLKKIAVDDENY